MQRIAIASIMVTLLSLGALARIEAQESSGSTAGRMPRTLVERLQSLRQSLFGQSSAQPGGNVGGRLYDPAPTPAAQQQARQRMQSTRPDSASPLSTPLLGSSSYARQPTPAPDAAPSGVPAVSRDVMAPRRGSTSPNRTADIRPQASTTDRLKRNVMLGPLSRQSDEPSTASQSSQQSSRRPNMSSSSRRPQAARSSDVTGSGDARSSRRTFQPDYHRSAPFTDSPSARTAARPERKPLSSATESRADGSPSDEAVALPDRGKATHVGSGSGSGYSPSTAGMPKTARKPLVIEQDPPPRVTHGGLSSRRSTSAADSGQVLAKSQSPDISVQTLGPRSIQVGREATYTVAARNTGSVAAHDMQVTVRVPEWAEVVAADATSGSAILPGVSDAAAGVRWTMGLLEADDSQQLTLRIIAHKSRPFDLAVAWAHSPVAAQTMVEVHEPKLVATLSGPEEVMYGQSAMYRLTLSNPGSGDAENVVVKLMPLSEGDDPGSHPVGTIGAGESKSLDLELTARDAGQLMIKAEATADGGLRSAAAHEILVRRADLKIEIESPEFSYAGTTSTYRIHVANPGNAVARNVEVAVRLPAGAKYVSSTDGGHSGEDATAVNWTLGSLPAGDDQLLELKCQLETEGNNRTQVVAVADDDLRDTDSSTTQVAALADLELDVIDPPGPIPVGDEVVYTIRVRNRGSKRAEDVNIVGFFSDGIDPIHADGAENRISPGQVVFETIPKIEAKEELVLKIASRALTSGDHVFRAEVHCEEHGSSLVVEESTRFFGPQASTPPPERR